MKELLTESVFSITKDSHRRHVLGVHQLYQDGLCDVGSSQHLIQLTDYGLNALEKNLKALLLVILDYKTAKSRDVRNERIRYEQR